MWKGDVGRRLLGAADKAIGFIGRLADAVEHADSGYARERLMSDAKTTSFDYVFGLARNEAKKRLPQALDESRQISKASASHVTGRLGLS